MYVRIVPVENKEFIKMGGNVEMVVLVAALDKAVVDLSKHIYEGL